jgi:hypothetical protein
VPADDGSVAKAHPSPGENRERTLAQFPYVRCRPRVQSAGPSPGRQHTGRQQLLTTDRGPTSTAAMGGLWSSYAAESRNDTVAPTGAAADSRAYSGGVFASCNAASLNEPAPEYQALS